MAAISGVGQYVFQQIARYDNTTQYNAFKPQIREG